MRDLRNRGFTLIELLSVMAIMMIIAGIAVASYFGMVRGVGMRSGVAHLRATLLLARQAAVMNGKRTCVIFGQSQTNAWYVVVQEAGRLTDVWKVPTRTRIGDGYSDWSYLGGEDIIGSTIYNLEGACLDHALVLTNVVDTNGVTVFLYTTNDGNWDEYDSYGWEMHPWNTLPSKYQFGDGEDREKIPVAVEFSGDGTTSREYPIQIYESLHCDPTDPHATVRVAKFTGFVSVD